MGAIMERLLFYTLQIDIAGMCGFTPSRSKRSHRFSQTMGTTRGWQQYDMLCRCRLTLDRTLVRGGLTPQKCNLAQPMLINIELEVCKNDMRPTYEIWDIELHHWAYGPIFD